LLSSELIRIQETPRVAVHFVQNDKKNQLVRENLAYQLQCSFKETFINQLKKENILG
tara:strand:+ start:22404 stop:22574 length:171 start_codon:yes stop_codon:yes gene_type:complete